MRTLEKLKSEVKEELISNILPFWSTKMVDTDNGGFYGQMDGHNQIIPKADKGGILNARILWTFSSAYLQEKNPLYLEMANRAKTYILDHFFAIPCPQFGFKSNRLCDGIFCWVHLKQILDLHRPDR